MCLFEKKQVVITGLLLVAITFVFFQFFFPYHLFFKEQIMLFINSADYFKSFFNKPGWFASYSGDFLIQYFYLRGGGASVLSLLILTEWILAFIVIKRIGNSKCSHFYALIPAGIDIAIHCSLFYNVSYSIGIVLSLLLFLLIHRVDNNWLQALLGLFFVCFGYWFFGSAILLFSLLLLLNEWHKKRNIIFPVIIVMMSVIFPIIARRYYLLTLEQAFIYPSLEKMSFLVPLLFLGSLFISIILAKFEGRFVKLNGYLVSFSSILLCCFWVNVFADFERERILSLDSETYFGNSDKVLYLSKKYNEKNRYTSYFTNIALARKGILSDSLMKTYQPAGLGLILPVNQDESWISIFFSNEMFYLVGDMNMAQHSAMLSNTFSPNSRSSRMIRRLAEINLVNGDNLAARKYLQLLCKTQFHSKWAQNQLVLLQSDRFNNTITHKQLLLPKSDTLLKSFDYIASLNFLVKENPDNRLALDYLLCYHLLNKDLESFISVYNLYGKKQLNPVPKVYEEALLIYLIINKATSAEAFTYNISGQSVNRFIEYNEMHNKLQNNLRPIQKEFGDSYWFYFHFAEFEKK